ncbi:hypothetical protein DIPPA_27933 [Diplonema papillatum]|nr:hypothetical protein DIPPA_27933 [Diplonema papillatum]
MNQAVTPEEKERAARTVVLSGLPEENLCVVLNAIERYVRCPPVLCKALDGLGCKRIAVETAKKDDALKLLSLNGKKVEVLFPSFSSNSPSFETTGSGTEFSRQSTEDAGGQSLLLASWAAGVICPARCKLTYVEWALVDKATRPASHASLSSLPADMLPGFFSRDVDGFPLPGPPQAVLLKIVKRPSLKAKTEPGTPTPPPAAAAAPRPAVAPTPPPAVPAQPPGIDGNDRRGRKRGFSDGVSSPPAELEDAACSDGGGGKRVKRDLPLNPGSLPAPARAGHQPEQPSSPPPAEGGDTPPPATASDDAASLLSLEALRNRLKLHIKDKEVAIEEESEEQKQRAAELRRKQDDDFRLATEEKLAKMQKQKEEKARAKLRDKALKEEAKKKKAGDKRLRKEYLDFCAEVEVKMKEKGAKYKPPRWDDAVERDFLKDFRDNLPDEAEDIAGRVKEKYRNYREIAAAYDRHLSKLSGSTFLSHLCLAEEIFKFGGLLSSTLIGLLTETLKDTITKSSAKHFRRFKELAESQWQPALPKEDWKRLGGLLKDAEKDVSRREEAEKVEKKRLRDLDDQQREGRRERERREAERQEREILALAEQAHVEQTPGPHGVVATTTYGSNLAGILGRRPTGMQGPGVSRVQQVPEVVETTFSANLSQLPEGWTSNLDPNTNRPYYIHTPSGHTSWIDPRLPAQDHFGSLI